MPIPGPYTSGSGSTDVQYPLAIDGDSIYVKDINIEESDNGNFSGEIIDLFNNLLTINHDTTTNNPKAFTVWFNRSIQTNSIGFGCNDLTHNFSNIVIKALGSGKEIRYIEDQSTNNTKHNSYIIDLPPLAANGFTIEFHTTDDVCLSNLIIWKSTDVNARIAGIRPDNKVGDVAVTNDNNLRVTEAESGLAIAKGDVSGTSFIHKFGKAPDFDILDGFVNIWDGADDSLVSGPSMLYSYSSTADIGLISSSDNADTQIIEIQGLDGDYNLITQNITLTGQTDVDLSDVGGTDLLRVFRMINRGNINIAGTLFLRQNGTTQTTGIPDDPQSIRAVIQNGNNQTLMALYTIPAGKTGYMRDWYSSTAGAKKDTVHEVKLFARPFGEVFQLKHDANIVTDGTSYVQHRYEEPEVFTEKTDVAMLVNTESDGAGVSGGFDIVLVDD